MEMLVIVVIWQTDQGLPVLNSSNPAFCYTGSGRSVCGVCVCVVCMCVCLSLCVCACVCVCVCVCFH